MRAEARIALPHDKIKEFCRRHYIRKLSVFGSALRDDFRPDSDVDILVEFEPGHVPGLIRLAGMELEMSEILDGRKVDMNTALCLSGFFRDEALQEAEQVYVAK